MQAVDSMQIHKALLAAVPEDCPVADVWVGLHWTVVALADGRCGMASTLTDAHEAHGEPQMREAGALHTQSALALTAYIDSAASATEVSVGWAALNALVSRSLEDDAAPPWVEMDALDFLRTHGAGRRVALVGSFPFVARLRDAVETLWVLELTPHGDELPASAAPEILPQADLVALTSMTLVNGTFASLVAHRAAGVPVLMLGPSTPLSPVLFAHGVRALAGVRVVDSAALRRSVMQGATFFQTRGVQKITVVHDAAS
jgi:uncharacterized protein (DUF4213/DUF364 family)